MLTLYIKLDFHAAILTLLINLFSNHVTEQMHINYI